MPRPTEGSGVATTGVSISTSVLAGPPSFEGAELPEPESRRRAFAIRAIAILAVALSVVYLSWRLLFTLDMAAWWLSVPLFVLELHAAFGLVMFTFSLWELNAVAPTRERQETRSRLAVMIPTYNEPNDVLLPTIAAAVALQPVHETWVLDDGNRPEVRALAERLGAHYVARTEHTHAKAGNINNALSLVDADFVAVLDADHVAAPGFLTRTLGYFDDPKVAVVQTPQDFYNLDSFEHNKNRSWTERRRHKALFNEQALFYRVIEPGKNRWDAAFWCGTGAVVRVAALLEVGGVATETVTEDIHTTIRLHRKGWRTIYHNEVLARGLAASDAQQYQAQRLRWGIGAMQLLRTENPLRVSGLRLRQRLAYAATLLGWFDAWRSLGYLLVPPAVLFTGAVPIRAHPVTFGVAFGVTFVIQRAALTLLARGFAPQGISTVFELVRMSPNLRATLTLFRPGRRAFQVTPKGRTGDQRSRPHAPRLLSLSLVVSVAAAAWFCLSTTGHTALNYEEPWAAYGAAFWLAVNTVFVLVAIRRIRSQRFAGERRASVRFDVDMAGRLGGLRCRIRDISLTGAKVIIPAERAVPLRSAEGPHHARVALPFGDVVLELDALVRSVRPAGDGEAVVGLEFAPDQDSTRARLALALFNAKLVPELEPAPAAVAAPLTPDAVPSSWLNGDGGHLVPAFSSAAASLPAGSLPPVSVLVPAALVEPLPVHTLAADPVRSDAPPVNGLPQSPWRRSDDDVLPFPHARAGGAEGADRRP